MRHVRLTARLSLVCGCGLHYAVKLVGGVAHGDIVYDNNESRGGDVKVGHLHYDHRRRLQH